MAEKDVISFPGRSFQSEREGALPRSKSERERERECACQGRGEGAAEGEGGYFNAKGGFTEKRDPIGKQLDFKESGKCARIAQISPRGSRGRRRCREQDPLGEGEGGPNPDSGMSTHTGLCARETASGVCCAPQTGGLCDHPEGCGGQGGGRGLKRAGTCAYLWLMHAGAWQKATPYYKANILQVKPKTLKLKGEEHAVPRTVIYSWEMTTHQQSCTLGMLRAKRNGSAGARQGRENRPFEGYGGTKSGRRILMWGLLSKLKPQRHERE